MSGQQQQQQQHHQPAESEVSCGAYQPPPPVNAPPSGNEYPAPEGYNAGYPAQPVYAQPVGGPMMQPMMGGGQYVVVEQRSAIDPKDHYNAACLGTACCGCIGCMATSCFCNTLSGKLGSATGCIIQSVVFTCFYVTAIILIVTKALTCSNDITPSNISQRDCMQLGDWYDGTCYITQCPVDYTYAINEYSEAYCKSDDHSSCLPVSLQSAVINTVLYGTAIGVCIYLRRLYTNQMRYMGNPNAHVVQVQQYAPQTQYVAFPAAGHPHNPHSPNNQQFNGYPAPVAP